MDPNLVTTVIVSLLGAGGIAAVVQLLLYPRTRDKVKADAAAVIVDSAGGLVADLRTEVVGLRADVKGLRADLSREQRITEDALSIVRQLLRIVRVASVDLVYKSEVVDLEQRAADLERRRVE